MKKYYVLFVTLFLFVFFPVMNFAQPVMNEIYSRGVTGALDWIEIYNPSGSSLDISGYKIYDSGGLAGTKPKKLFPSGTVIPAMGFHVIVTDTASFEGDQSAFGLSSGGETVWLEDASGLLIDSVVFPAMGVDTSYGRMPDGSAQFSKIFPLTRGTNNAPAKLNEIYSRGVPGNLDWVEIYNVSDVQIDISGFQIYDSGGKAGTKPKKLFPDGSIIPGKGYLVIVTDTASFEGDQSAFGLSSGGETIWLENAAGILIDSSAFSAMEVTQSFGRFPDGSANWQLLNKITRNAANDNVTAVEDKDITNTEYNLYQNYPNPFNPSTTISYSIKNSEHVTLVVFNLLGMEVVRLVDGIQNEGYHKIEFDARNLSSGVYIYQLSTGSYSETRKLTLLK